MCSPLCTYLSTLKIPSSGSFKTKTCFKVAFKSIPVEESLWQILQLTKMKEFWPARAPYYVFYLTASDPIYNVVWNMAHTNEQD